MCSSAEGATIGLMATGRRILMLLALALIALSMMSASSAGSPGSGLSGKRWVSVKVVRNGSPHELVSGTRVKLKLVHEAKRDVARWSAGCNLFGGELSVTPRRLLIGQVTQTEMGCSPPLHRQDRWLARFFASDPRWARQGQRLRLRSGDDLVVFRVASA